MSPSKAAANVPGFWGMLWRLVVAGTIVLGLAGAGAYWLVDHMIATPEHEVPDLVTKDFLNAARRASSEGFSVRIDREEKGHLVGAGHVRAQRPAPGDKAKAGAVISLVLEIPDSTTEPAK